LRLKHLNHSNSSRLKNRRVARHSVCQMHRLNPIHFQRRTILKRPILFLEPAQIGVMWAEASKMVIAPILNLQAWQPTVPLMLLHCQLASLRSWSRQQILRDRRA
jgi:hypothetical protein